jgi:hypothetical protein
VVGDDKSFCALLAWKNQAGLFARLKLETLRFHCSASLLQKVLIHLFQKKAEENTGRNTGLCFGQPEAKLMLHTV